MKKVKPAKRTSKAKRSRAPKNVNEYLAGIAEPGRGMLIKMRKVIRSAMPSGTSETVSYSIPAFKYKKRAMVWFAAFSNHCSLFPGASVIEAFENELKGFSTSKGTIHFPTNKPLPTTLIRKLVKARVAEKENE
jgi:uncharacterized protein YdhG (YjbR/CyaY superfamily)